MTELRDKRIAIVGVGLMGGLLLDRLLAAGTCAALMHSYTCYVLGREKAIRRYTLGSIDREEITRIWDGDEYVQFRARVQQFDFSPCADCGGCQLAESNEEDCFGNQFPVCGDCLWARGIILCP